MKKLLAAAQFLTIIPIRIKGNLSREDISASSAFFPIIGFLQGAILSGIALISLKFFSPGVTSALILAAYILTNGGFHLDGLSDTFDALSVKSSGDDKKDKQRRLDVMRDPAAGPIGTAAVTMSLILKYALLNELVKEAGYVYFNSVVFIMPVISKWSMTMMIKGAVSARNDGLGKIFFDGVKRRHAIAASVLMVTAACFIYFLTGLFACVTETCLIYFFLLALVLSLCAGYGLRFLCTARFGGLTGDNLGAIHEVSEITFLLAAILCF